MPILPNARHERFCQEIASGKTADAAYVAAGYVSNRSNANHLRRSNNIQTRIGELLAEREKIHAKATAKAMEKMAIDKAWVIAKLVENAQRALQAVRVGGEDGEEGGEYQYNGSVANRALELLGKELGMFIDRKEIGQPGDFSRLSDEELDTALAEQARALGLPEDAVGRLMDLRSGSDSVQ